VAAAMMDCMQAATARKHNVLWIGNSRHGAAAQQSLRRAMCCCCSRCCCCCLGAAAAHGAAALTVLLLSRASGEPCAATNCASSSMHAGGPAVSASCTMVCFAGVASPVSKRPRRPFRSAAVAACMANELTAVRCSVHIIMLCSTGFGSCLRVFPSS
jgi:hypothetical protein